MNKTNEEIVDKTWLQIKELANEPTSPNLNASVRMAISEVLEAKDAEWAAYSEQNGKDAYHSGYTDGVATCDERVAAAHSTYICTRKGIHTCRLNAIHIPENYLGTIEKLLANPAPQD